MLVGANGCTEHILLPMGFELTFFSEARQVVTFFLPQLPSLVYQILVFLQLYLSSLLEATASHIRPSLHKSRAARQLLPPLFHAATGRPSFGTHLAHGGLYVCCSMLDLDSSGLGIELLQWSFIKQTLHIVLV